MRNILYVSLKEAEREAERNIKDLEERGYTVVYYTDTIAHETIRSLLEENFFYFVISFEFYAVLSKACVVAGTKYVVRLPEESYEILKTDNIGTAVNYIMVSDEVLLEKIKAQGGRAFYIPKEETVGWGIEKWVFNKSEWNIYELIERLVALRDKYRTREILFRDLGKLESQEELLESTDIYFDRLEEEKQMNFALKEQVAEYVEALLRQRNFDSWRELVLWNNRHGVRELKNTFWQFYILWNIMSVYVEEMKAYIEMGVIPCVLQFGSLEEMTDTYFVTLFLLRRLEYDIAPEEERDIISYIVERNLSGILLMHIIKDGQIDNKGKVAVRIKELLANYEQ